MSQANTISKIEGNPAKNIALQVLRTLQKTNIDHCKNKH